DERVRPLIVQALRNAGFHVESFTTCAAAASVFERNPAGWAVALLEFSTTEDAPGCAHVLRRTTPTLPVLLLTSNPADASGNFADAHTRVLLKPFTVGSLRSALSDLLKQPAPR
ncbi:MAG: hypothetical protein K2Q09_10050, partial [Phycisphaerales bacterium]|nr:hypothetical protein [Phycisphaerales bacterium]